MVPGFDAALILTLSLIGTFVFGLSGAVAGVRARLDLFGVLVLAAVVGLAGGVIRDLLIGRPPATFRDWRYLAAVGAAGLVGFFARPLLERLHRPVQIFDAAGLAVFCVAGAGTALEFGVGPAQAVILATVTAIGGGMLRDILLRQIPAVLRQELYAVPALIGATILVTAHAFGWRSPVFAVFGALVCFVVRLIGVHFAITVPIAPSERRRTDPADPSEPPNPS